MSTEKKELTLSLTKSTKNKHVYTDIDIDPTIQTVYIEKTALPKTPPDLIKITIEY